MLKGGFIGNGIMESKEVSGGSGFDGKLKKIGQKRERTEEKKNEKKKVND